VADNSDEMEEVFNFVNEATASGDTERTFIPIQQLCERIQADTMKRSAEIEVVTRLAQHLSNEKVPVLDVLKLYEEKAGIERDKFDVLLADGFRVEHYLTANMIAMLKKRYNPRDERYIPSKPLIDDLAVQAQESAIINFFRTSADVDAFREAQASKSLKPQRKTVLPKDEPNYVSRSDKNTYFF
jgi:hypothetical protein